MMNVEKCCPEIKTQAFINFTHLYGHTIKLKLIEKQWPGII